MIECRRCHGQVLGVSCLQCGYEPLSGIAERVAEISAGGHPLVAAALLDMDYWRDVYEQRESRKESSEQV